MGTTIVYMVSYYLTRLLFPDAESVPSWLQWIYRITDVFGIESSTALPVIVSWFLSVTFAFLTNRVYVFESHADTFGKFMLEALKLYATRLATLLVNLLLMFLLVDLPQMHNFVYEFIAMIFTNIIVLILNYVLSRIFVFRKKKTSVKKKK
ncbi:MAG: GtrA family protein [Oscillospiraceae bacterium]|nr:GtrA family protein [Oscillospiraceae bacterium]